MTDTSKFTPSRSLLLQAHAEVKKHFPETNLRNGCWTHRSRCEHDSWEFHGPNRFSWNGRASNAYEARYKGWMAWLRSKGVNLEEAA